MSSVQLHLLFKRLQVMLPPVYWRYIKNEVLKNLKSCCICGTEGFFYPTQVELHFYFDDYSPRGDWRGQKVFMCDECDDISDDFYDHTYDGFNEMDRKIMGKKEEYREKGGYVGYWRYAEKDDAAYIIQRWWLRKKGYHTRKENASIKIQRWWRGII